MDLKFILEAILFSAQKPLSLKELRDVSSSAVEHADGNETVRGFKKVKEEQLTAALEELATELQREAPAASDAAKVRLLSSALRDLANAQR